MVHEWVARLAAESKPSTVDAKLSGVALLVGALRVCARSAARSPRLVELRAPRGDRAAAALVAT
jgi:hypothetical protein